MFAPQRTMQTDPGTDSRPGPPPPSADAARTDPEGLSSVQPVPQQPAQTDDATVTSATPVELQTSPEESTALEGSSDTPFWSLSDFTGSGGLPGMLMAGGAIILVFILMGRLRKGRRASAPDHRTPKEHIAEIRARAGDRSQIEAFKVDAQDFTRQMAALLDTKAARLEALITDADDRLARLAHLEQHVDRHRGPANNRPGTSGANGSSQAPRGMTDDPAREHVDPLHERVYRLADDGLDTVQIARQTGQPTGQIELILALRS